MIRQLALWSILLLPAPMGLSADAPLNCASKDEIVAALTAKGFKHPEVTAHYDLTQAFRTASTWTLAAVQDNTPIMEGRFELESHGPISLCFLKDKSPHCADSAGNPLPPADESGPPFQLLEVIALQASADELNPRLLVKTCRLQMFNGDCGVETTVYVYDRTTDRFRPVFRNLAWSNNNQETRFIRSGPLRGTIIEAIPGDNAPFTYWMEVQRQQGSGDYTRILRYRGKTRYADGNRLAVIDSEMPETLRRLGLWKSGDPLPEPPTLPERCTTLFMREGVEWCK